MGSSKLFFLGIAQETSLVQIVSNEEILAKMTHHIKFVILVLFVIAGFQCANSLKCKKCGTTGLCDGKNESDDTCASTLTHCYNSTAVSKTTTVTARSCIALPSGTTEGCKTTSAGTGDAEVKTTVCYCKTDLCNMAPAETTTAAPKSGSLSNKPSVAGFFITLALYFGKSKISS